MLYSSTPNEKHLHIVLVQGQRLLHSSCMHKHISN